MRRLDERRNNGKSPAIGIYRSGVTKNGSMSVIGFDFPENPISRKDKLLFPGTGYLVLLMLISGFAIPVSYFRFLFLV